MRYAITNAQVRLVLRLRVRVENEGDDRAR